MDAILTNNTNNDHTNNVSYKKKAANNVRTWPDK